MQRITSFTVDHDLLEPGIYISRVDGDVTTYDLRTRKPNSGCYMDDLTMHSVEHMFATFVRNSPLTEDVLYFGPMGCQTGFYLLVRNADHSEVLDVLRESLQRVIDHTGPVFGASRKECGNYASLDLKKAQDECARYLEVIRNWTADDLGYPHG